MYAYKIFFYLFTCVFKKIFLQCSPAPETCTFFYRKDFVMNSIVLRALLTPAALLTTFPAQALMLKALALVAMTGPFGLVMLPFVHNANEKKPEIAAGPAQPQPEIQQAVVAQPMPVCRQTSEVDVARTIRSTLERIPQHKDNPVIINVNLTTQQTSASAGGARPEAILPSDTERPGAITSFLSNKLYSAIAWIKAHKFKSATVTCTALYASLQALLWKLARKLQEPSCWSLWKNHCTIEDLYKIPRHDLCKSMFDSSESQTLQKTQSVLKDMDCELTHLSQYQNLTSFLERWHLRKLFFFNATLLASIHERSQRLRYLKSSLESLIQEKSTEPILFQHSK
jgi:hypothetical protein